MRLFNSRIITLTAVCLSVAATFIVAAWPSQDWLAKLSAVSTLATAACTGVLGWFTYVLAKETVELRRQADRARKEAAMPNLIVYVDLDIASLEASVILQNVTHNPAYDVTIRFDPDPSINQRKSLSADKHQHLSNLFSKVLEIVAPNQRIVRFLGLHTDGTGDFGPIANFETTAVLSYRDSEGHIIEKRQILTTNSMSKAWISAITPMGRVERAIDLAGEKISGTLRAGLIQGKSFPEGVE